MMLGSRSQQAIYQPTNELKLKVPKPSAQDPPTSWAANVNEQLSTFKSSQAQKFLPQVAKSQSQMPTLQPSMSQASKIAQRNHPQFSTLNCEPYSRDGEVNFGVSKCFISNWREIIAPTIFN